jgi:hypothetical protein
MRRDDRLRPRTGHGWTLRVTDFRLAQFIKRVRALARLAVRGVVIALRLRSRPLAIRSRDSRNRQHLTHQIDIAVAEARRGRE